MFQRKPFFTAVAFSWGLSCGLSSAQAGPLNCSRLASQHPMVAGTIGLVAEASVDPRVIDEAIALWQTCENYGVGFPAFRLGANGTLRQIVVSYQKVRVNPGRRKRCGWFSGNAIVLFGNVLSSKGRLLRCGPPAKNLAHELGHVLGLLDSPDGPACATHIMSDLTPENLFNRFVRGDECVLLERRWLMPAEVAELNRRRREGFGVADLPEIDDLRRSSRRPAAGRPRLEL